MCLKVKSIASAASEGSMSFAQTISSDEDSFNILPVGIAVSNVTPAAIMLPSSPTSKVV